MISRRVLIVAGLVALVLLAGTIAQTELMNFGSLAIPEDSAGPVKLTSAAFTLPGRPVTLASGWRGSAAALLYHWKDPETQAVLGPIRAAVLWTTTKERSWTRAGSVCDFLLSTFGPGDKLVTVPGMDALTMKNMHICQCTSAEDGRQWFYAYQMPDARCRTNALVFWTVPWTLSGEAPGAEELNARMDGGMKARAFNALRAVIQADADCGETVGSLSRGIVAAMVVGTLSILMMLGLLYKRTL